MLLQEHDRLGRIDLPRFYARRALRLYPALIVLVILASTAAALRGVGSPPADGVAAATYVTDIYANIATHPSLVLHTWSLSVEEQFYLIWPAVLIVSLRREWPPAKVIAVAIAVSFAITLFLGVSAYPHVAFVQFLPTSHVAELGTGILLAVALRNGTASVVRRVSGPGNGRRAGPPAHSRVHPRSPLVGVPRGHAHLLAARGPPRPPSRSPISRGVLVALRRLVG